MVAKVRNRQRSIGLGETNYRFLHASLHLQAVSRVKCDSTLGRIADERPPFLFLVTIGSGDP